MLNSVLPVAEMDVVGIKDKVSENNMDTKNQTQSQNSSVQAPSETCVEKLKTILSELSKDSGFMERLKELEKRHTKYKISIVPSTKDDALKILAGAGIASIRGSWLGMRMKAEDYAAEFINNSEDISNVLVNIKNSIQEDHTKENTENLKVLYEKLCAVLPQKSCNNVSNRFVASYLFDNLTTIAKFKAVCEVLEYLGEDNLNSNESYWLPYSLNLRQIIKEACKEDNYKEFDKASLGWELVEYVRTVKKNDELFRNSKNVILTGAPGTGKTYLAHILAKRLTNNKEENIKMVQFHPSYDYSDFVEGLRPVKDATGHIGFERRDGVFKAFCKKALKAYNQVENNQETQKYVFIIDEINRGEMSKIFGELFFSIDPGYRGVKGKIQTQFANMQDTPNEFDKQLGISEEQDSNGKILNTEDFGNFFVPENVYIIGTMNDIDRSVESMDFAMRRRFTFVEVTAEDRQNMLDGLEYAEELKMRMNNVNSAIDKIPGLNSAYHIGPAYFLKYKQCIGTTPKQKFNALWNNHIKGVIYEYLRGNPDADKYIEDINKAYNKNVED